MRPSIAVFVITNILKNVNSSGFTSAAATWKIEQGRDLTGFQNLSGLSYPKRRQRIKQMTGVHFCPLPDPDSGIGTLKMTVYVEPKVSPDGFTSASAAWKIVQGTDLTGFQNLSGLSKTQAAY